MHLKASSLSFLCFFLLASSLGNIQKCSIFKVRWLVCANYGRHREHENVRVKIWKYLVGEPTIVMIYDDEFVVCLTRFVRLHMSAYNEIFISFPSLNVILRRILLTFFTLNFATSYFI